LRIAEHIYGSNQHGLIWGYHFAPERAVETIDSEAALGRVSCSFRTAQRQPVRLAALHRRTLIALTGVLIYVVFGKRRD